MGVIRPVFTRADLEVMPEDGRRYEVLEGDLAVSPAPKRRHQRTVSRLDLLFARAEAAGYGEGYVAPFDVCFDESNVVEPDGLFVCRGRLTIVTEDDVQGAPDLIAEVLSPSTRARDLGAKLRTYARFGVRFYWVLDPDAGTVRVFTLGPEGYAEAPPLGRGDLLTCPLFPGIEVPVADLFPQGRQQA